MSHLDRLLTELTRSSALPDVPESVEVIQTHASVVFLTPTHVYKLKKPLDLGFLDYSTLDKREHCCREEVRLNRRLAPDVYLGVEPVTEGPSGLQVGGDGPPLEWVVHMRRLDDSHTLRSRLSEGSLPSEVIDAVGARVAQFHASAESGPASFASFDVVAETARDNVRTLRELDTHPELVDRLEQATERELAQHASTIAARAHRAIAIHGDLRLEHVYWRPERAAPDDLVIIDCIEFSDALRFAEPVADIAFLSMDLRAYGAWDLAARLETAWTEASGDVEGAALFPFYVAYRSAVRAKVAALTAAESEVPEPARAAARARLLRHLLLALQTLETHGPTLVAVGGLPGTGKSTVARVAANVLHAEVVRSDVVRKELVGLRPEGSAAAAPDQGLYTPEHTARTYEEVLRRARTALTEGGSVVVDATWSKAALRASLQALAVELGVPFRFLVCELPEHLLKERIASRKGDASDADFGIYLHAKARWEPVADATDVVHIDTSPSADEVGRAVKEALVSRP